MTQEELLRRINPLARKKREGTATKEELAELEEIRPLADEAEQSVASLKARKKELLAKKKELEENAGNETEVPDEDDTAKEVSSDE